jgi:hypothetical protein
LSLESLLLAELLPVPPPSIWMPDLMTSAVGHIRMRKGIVMERISSANGWIMLDLGMNEYR